MRKQSYIITMPKKIFESQVELSGHPHYVYILNNLANIYANMGNYEKAERQHLQAKEVRAKILGIEHPDYASTLYNLAYLYYNIGDYEKAEPLFLKSKEIREKSLEQDHPRIASTLHSLCLTIY